MRLPNGTALQSDLVCKVQVQIAGKITRKITFIIIEMQLPFVFGMLFLQEANAKVGFGSHTMQIG